MSYIAFTIFSAIALWLAKRIFFREKNDFEKRILSVKGVSLKEGDYCYSHDSYEIYSHLSFDEQHTSILCSNTPKDLSNLFIHFKDGKLFIYSNELESIIKIKFEQVVFKNQGLSIRQYKFNRSSVALSEEKFLSLDKRIEDEKIILKVMES